jgi:hypothetical protein
MGYKENTKNAEINKAKSSKAQKLKRIEDVYSLCTFEPLSL